MPANRSEAAALDLAGSSARGRRALRSPAAREPSPLGSAGLIALALALTTGCGRTSMDFPIDEDLVADGGSVGDDIEPGNGHEGGELPDDEPPVDPPLPASCHNGIIEPGELCFLPQVTYWSRIDPCALDLGDFDGDGHLDVVTPNSDFEHAESAQNFTSVLYGDGQGRLSDPVPYVTADDIPVGVRAGDLDLDGALDVVVVNSDAGSMTVLLNQPELDTPQLLRDAGRVSAGQVPVIADLGDIDGDGVLDVAVGSEGAIRVAQGWGNGLFRDPVTYPHPDGLAGQFWATRLADVDGDGDLDMLSTSLAVAAVYVWHNDGTGTMQEAGSLAMPGMAFWVSQADLDADGNQDLLVAHDEGVRVMRGNGNGGYSVSADFPAGQGARGIVVADYDSDGVLDVATVSSISQDVTIVRGRGDATFDTGAVYSVGNQPSGIVTGDFNEDGVPDLAVSNQLSNNIGLILSAP